MTEQNILETFHKIGISYGLEENQMIKTASPAVFGSLASFLGKNIGFAIPALAALTAGGVYMGEKELNEDNKDLEKLKAEILAYRASSGKLVGKLKEKGLSEDQIAQALEGENVDLDKDEYVEARS